jgi:hypothetical protein
MFNLIFLLWQQERQTPLQIIGVAQEQHPPPVEDQQAGVDGLYQGDSVMEICAARLG